MTHAELSRALEANPKLAKRNKQLVDFLCHAQPQPALRHEPLGAAAGKEQVPRRIRVSLTAYRGKLADPDNLCAKYIIDCLRYCGAIADDDAKHIEVCIRQVRTPALHLAGTLIELIPLNEDRAT